MFDNCLFISLNIELAKSLTKINGKIKPICYIRYSALHGGHIRNFGICVDKHYYLIYTVFVMSLSNTLSLLTHLAFLFRKHFRKKGFEFFHTNSFLSKIQNGYESTVQNDWKKSWNLSGTIPNVLIFRNQCLEFERKMLEFPINAFRDISNQFHFRYIYESQTITLFACKQYLSIWFSDQIENLQTFAHFWST